MNESGDREGRLLLLSCLHSSNMLPSLSSSSIPIGFTASTLVFQHQFSLHIVSHCCYFKSFSHHIKILIWYFISWSLFVLHRRNAKHAIPCKVHLVDYFSDNKAWCLKNLWLKWERRWEVGSKGSGYMYNYFVGLQNHCRWWLQPWN